MKIVHSIYITFSTFSETCVQETDQLFSVYTDTETKRRIKRKSASRYYPRTFIPAAAANSYILCNS